MKGEKRAGEKGKGRGGMKNETKGGGSGGGQRVYGGVGRKKKSCKGAGWRE